jgi:hypothetical protein
MHLPSILTKTKKRQLTKRLEENIIVTSTTAIRHAVDSGLGRGDGARWSIPRDAKAVRE